MAKERLEQARAAYSQATVDTDVQTYASVPLSEAGKALQQAEASTDFEDMESRAYVAEKKVRTAQAIAGGKKAETEVQLLRKESTDVLLRKREREAEMARGEAAEKGRELEKLKQGTRAEEARALAVSSALEAEKARAEAQRMSRELSELKASQTETKTRETEQARILAERRAEQAKALAETRSREAELAKAESERLSRELSEQKVRQTEVLREAEKSKAENVQLVEQLSDLKAKQTERGIVLTLGDVLFPFGKAGLSAQARKGLEKLTEFLGSHPNRNILIEGHTDNVGGDSYNLGLSQKRAEAVKTLLTDRGIDAKRIATKGYGKKYPVASNATSHGRQLNRRVEVIILDEGVKPEAVSR